MNRSLGLGNQYVRIGLAALALFCGVLILLAPATGQKTSGSTFNRAPEGYLGWYRYMEEQGIAIQRWQRPIPDLLAQTSDTPQTLLRVYPGLVNVYIAQRQDWIEDWLAAGNNLVVLGVGTRVAEAPFNTVVGSPNGNVRVKTRRRQWREPASLMVLGDDHGAIVWRDALPNDTTPNPTTSEASEGAFGGVAYWAVTPHLAANAYIDAPGNYAFLADLVTQLPGPIWVDEYLHGYKAANVIVEEVVNSWEAYLSRTPITVAVIQLVIVLGIFLLAQNRRLGNLSPLKPPQVDNSQAYIEALAAVLHKAKSTPFLVDMITKAERSALQRSLGFNDPTVEDQALQTAWTTQTSQSKQALTPLLKPPRRITKQADAVLKQWLAKLRQIHHTPLR